MADYIVKAGDTLSKIAKANGMTVKDLAELNGIKDVNNINIGQELSLGKVSEEAAPPEPAEADTSDLEARMAALERENAMLKEQGLGDLLEKDLTKLWDKTVEKYEEVEDKVVETYRDGVEWVENTYDKAERAVVETYRDGVEWVENTYDKAERAVVETYKDGVEWVENTYDKAERAVVDGYNDAVEWGERTYEKGKKAVVGAYEDAKQGVKDAGHAIDGAIDGAADRANNSAQRGIAKAQARADARAENMKFDEEEPVDTSGMTLEERIEHAEKENAALKERGVWDMVTDGAKGLWNDTVDKVHGWGNGVRNGVSKAAKGASNWVKGLFNW